MSERSIGITLLGHGIVGSGVVKILTQQRELLRQRTGLTFDIRHIVVRDPAKHAGSGLPCTSDAKAAIADPKSEIIIELMGGTGAAAEYVDQALKLGKPVVTANKSLLASRGQELFQLARQHNACIAFEASCGGGVPIIEALSRGLLANRIDALVGIVNGTCNFILTQMTRHEMSYADALRGAQDAGFAEADPTMDVSGRDAAQKLALLAGLAFNVRVAESNLHIEGIDKVYKADIQLARELGYVIKLLAIAERNDGDQLSLRVHPTLVHKDDVLADVSSSFNAISIYGHALGHALFYGRGAGQMPTASAVVSDLLAVGMGTAPLAFKQLRIFPDSTPPARLLPIDDLRSRYYLRIMVKDQPGVIGQVSTLLGHQGISISAIRQHETEDMQTVPIVITTHVAREGAMRQALADMNALQPVVPPAVCLRIIDPPKEFKGNAEC